LKLQKQKSKPNTNILAWVAIGISLFSLLISVSQYIRTQRPKIAIHPDTRLFSKNKNKKSPNQALHGKSAPAGLFPVSLVVIKNMIDINEQIKHDKEREAKKVW
jgi:hypothetical protein